MYVCRCVFCSVPQTFPFSVHVQVFGRSLSSCAMSSEKGAAAVGISVSFKSNAYFK